MREQGDLMTTRGAAVVDSMPLREAIPIPQCPEWCSSPHADGDLEAGEYLCVQVTLEAPGLEVGVQAGVYLEDGALTYGSPEVYLLGREFASLSPGLASAVAGALGRATALAEWTRPPALRLVAGGHA